MRLLRLDYSTRKWILEDFPPGERRIPLYATLSHTWGRDEDEVKFDDVIDGQRDFSDTGKAGYDKLRFCQGRVEEDGLRYFWIDTCCINKSDSSERQISLASMFYWYRRASRCYVYLADVSVGDGNDGASYEWEKAFSKSRWFKRGWTLQELLAPSHILFFSKEGRLLGSKEDLASTIGSMTKLPGSALRGLEMSRFSKEQRLSWAKGRVTKVPEDTAYCLIGIFEVELPVLYAEGAYDQRRAAAMARLNAAITDKKIGAGKAEDVVRIGGASWSDLSTLNGKHLRRLDLDLEEYCQWLLVDFPKKYEPAFGHAEAVKELSQIAGERMKALLANHNVRYNDLSDQGVTTTSWKQPWKRYRDKTATDQDRVQGLVENRWYWMNKNESSYTGTTAFRTLQDLMIWRGKWQK
ncbi:HET-domain-containing protein [Setomelanomma holmii]|uniref:HET-domain-containing protein n=1 Tax=Setomelanomma holmii TaxID=210430 RepID=A0A9P4LHS9_9PLEO|nr:HET-domain-containing protein [Setomelanomma holmii]